MSKKKNSIIVLAVLIGLPVAELVREEIAYLIVSRKMKAAYERTEIGLTKEEVKSLAGEPHSVTATSDDETWHWGATNHQGALWEALGLAWVKGHYTLNTTFDENGRVARKSGGIN